MTRRSLMTPPSPYDGDTSPSRNPRRGGEENRRWRMSLTVAQQPRALALPVAILDRLALVMGLLAGDQGDLDLGAAARIEIELQRHDGAALALDGADQLVDLLAVQQELARPARLVIEAGARGVFRVVGIPHPGPPALLGDVGFADQTAPAAQRLDLGAGQSEPRLEGLLDEV